MIERSVASTATLALAGACWIVAIHQSSGMDMGASTDLGSFSFFVAAWASMTAAMMLPGAVPPSRDSFAPTVACARCRSSSARTSSSGRSSA
jgi:hypothetical protein